MISKCAKTYCNEDISRIENYDKAVADKEQIWDCHHRRELETPRKELIKIGEYYKRPAEELIFLTKAEHTILHFKGNKIWLGRHHTEEAKKKISALKKGNKNRLGKHLSEEHKQKLYAVNKGKHISDETKRKMSESHKGLNFFNNGTITVRAKSCPEGFVRGRLKKVKQI